MPAARISVTHDKHHSDASSSFAVLKSVQEAYDDCRESPCSNNVQPLLLADYASR